MYSYTALFGEEASVTRAKVNLTLDSDLAQEARALGLNMSRQAEDAISKTARIERNRLWREQNRDALNAYAQEVAQCGLPLAKYRTF